MKQQEQGAGATPDISNDPDRSQYELRVDGKVAAIAQYRMEGGAVAFTHTEVDSAYEGQGLGSKIAAYALDDIKRRGLKAIPRCKFIAGYIARHEKEYGALVQS
jgi:predicted GNAT family acetyltransferase